MMCCNEAATCITQPVEKDRYFMEKDHELLGADTGSGDTRNLSGGTTSDDIGLLDAVDVPIIVIGRDCTVARINRAARTVLGLGASDVGCALRNPFAGVENLQKLCARVIADGAPHRIETRDGDRCFLLRIAPYTSSDSQILGAVLTFTNVTAFRASIDQAIYEREYTKAILNTVTDPLVVLDTELCVQTANRAFYGMFGLSRDESQDISIRKLGNSEWATSELWKSVEKTLFDDTQFQAVEIEREFPAIGTRTIVLNARRLARDGHALILLTFQDVTKRKQTERALSEKARLLDLSNDAIFVRDSADHVTYWNRAATDLYGFTREEALGRVSHELLRTQFPARLEKINQQLHRDERWSGELVHTKKNGTKVIVISRWALDRKSDGNSWCILETNNDVTKQKRTENALRESEERFRAIVETTPECVKLISAEGILLHMNLPGLRMIGADSAQEVVGKSLYSLIAPEDRDRYKAFNERICRGEQGSLQFDIVGLEGKRRQMESHAAPLRNPDGTLVHLAVTADISERKRAEELLRRSEERFRALVNASSDVVYHMSPDWGELGELDGRGFVADAGEPSKDWLNEYIHPDDQPRVLQTIHEATRTKSTFQLEHRIRRVDGTLGWTYSRAVPLLGLNGEILEWFGAASDVTARKEAEEKYRKLAQTLEAEVRARTRELEEQSNQVRELSWRLLRSQDEERRKIARELHDSVGQMLVALSLNIAAVQNHGLDRQIAQSLSESASFVDQISREIRTISHLLHPPLLEVAGLISAVRWYVDGFSERSNIKVDLDLPERFGRLSDEMEITVFRFIQESLTNIHRHSGSSTARIAIREEQPELVVEIKDWGKGIPPSKQIDLSSGRTGVGFRGMRERLKQFGGRLDIHSNGDGTMVTARMNLVPESSVDKVGESVF
jgi:PAS domain S-box-containing protein